MRSLLLILACAALTSCGQTGSLYLPDKEAEVVGSAPGADARTTDSDESDAKRDKVVQPTPPAPQ